MPVDSSVYGNLRALDIGKAMAEGSQIKKARMENQALEAEALKKQKIQDAYKSSMNPDGTVDQKKLVSQIGMVDGEKAIGLGREFKNDGDKDLERQMKQLKVQGQLLGSATDDATWLKAKQTAASMGIDVSQLPDHYDESLKTHLMGSTLEAEKQLDIKWREQEAKRQQDNADRDFSQKLKEFDRSGQQWTQSFGLQKDQFGYTKTQGDRNFGLELEKFGYTKEKDQTEFGLKEREVKVKEAEAGKKTEQRKQMQQRYSNIAIQDATRALNTVQSNDWASGPLVGQSKRIPGTPAYNLDSMLESVKANSSFDRLQAMRESSPTGGALGSVSDSENKLLQASLGKLDPTLPKEVLEDNLKRVINTTLDIVHGPGNGPKRHQLSFDENGNPVSPETMVAAPDLNKMSDEQLDALLNQLGE